MIVFCGLAIRPWFEVAASPIVTPAGLQPGDTYRLLFVTTSDTTATSSNITDYNAFVTAQAYSEPMLASLGTTWKAVASTATESAIENTGTNPAVMGQPIYNLAGSLLATSNADLWDGALSSPVMFDEHGAAPHPGHQEVWTGTELNGAAGDPDEVLGSATPSWGLSDSATSWIYAGHGTYPASGEHTFYAISGVLTVPAPEPSTAALTLLGCLSLWRVARWRKS
jgi:hypothetical protein